MKTKPIVTVATACENVLLEGDGVASVIRLVDRFTLSAQVVAKGSAQGLPKRPDIANLDLPIQIKAFIGLKSGDFKGQGELSLKAHLPDGTRKDFPQKWTFLMEGDDKGVNVRLQFGLSSKHMGLTWIEVYWDGELLSKFPVRLMPEQGSAPPSETH